MLYIKYFYYAYQLEYDAKGGDIMFEESFPARLTQLRNKMGVSARDMSLSIGQNPGYINNIETGKALPSMTAFFYICDYLKITPQEFFDLDAEEPAEIRDVIINLKKLSPEQLQNISSIIKGLIK